MKITTSKMLSRIRPLFFLALSGSLIAGAAMAKDWKKGRGAASKPAGSVLAHELRMSQRDENQVDKDVNALLRKLDNDKAFSTRLRESMLKQDSATATKLIQSTAVSKVSVMFEREGSGRTKRAMSQTSNNNNRLYKGHICWYRNGVRKCLWYSAC